MERPPGVRHATRPDPGTTLRDSITPRPDFRWSKHTGRLLATNVISRPNPAKGSKAFRTLLLRSSVQDATKTSTADNSQAERSSSSVVHAITSRSGSPRSSITTHSPPSSWRERMRRLHATNATRPAVRQVDGARSYIDPRLNNALNATRTPMQGSFRRMGSLQSAARVIKWRTGSLPASTTTRSRHTNLRALTPESPAHSATRRRKK